MSELINLLRKNGNETPENIAKILNKSLDEVKSEIHELEQVPNPTPKLQKLILSAKFLLRDINRIPKYCV